MRSGPALLGAVLAGGRSRRFGSDKAGAIFDGRTLLERAATTVATVADPVVISGPPGALAHALGVPVVPDLRADAGPLAGLEALLTVAEREGMDGVVVLACDLPLVETSTLRALADVLIHARAAAAAAGAAGLQPLCAAYRTECRARVQAALDAGERSVRDCFRSLGGVQVEADPRQLRNVNTPADLEGVLAELASEGP